MTEQDALELARWRGGVDEKLDRVLDELVDLKKGMTHRYVTKDEFRPLQRVAYGLVATVGSALVATLAYFTKGGGA